MARANNGGWDFVKVGESYQYKEDWFIAMVTVLEDKSTEDEYVFNLRVDKANHEPPQNGEFEISHAKEVPGIYGGMLQIYKFPEYMCNYKYVREQTTTDHENK